MQTDTHGFLDNLYSGVLHHDQCFTNLHTVDEARVAELVEELRAATAGYRPADLEAQGADSQ